VIERLRTLVEHESPTSDVAACRALLEDCAGVYRALGAVTEIVDGDGGTPVLLARFGAQRRPGMIIGHVDTVFPHGELFRRPFRIVGNHATGPGVMDMKAGLVQLEQALRIQPDTDVTVLINADEEIGSPGSARIIRQVAERAAWALILEPATADGKIKTARKGIGFYRLEVTGRAAHPGLDFASGVNAAVEAAHQILALAALTDLDAGTTVNVGVCTAGTGRNVVPAAAAVELESRFWTAAEAERIDKAVRALEAIDPRATLSVSGGVHKPPFQRDERVAALFALARQCAAELGWQLEETAVGGVSDGNITAGMNVPTLDGLGAVGGGAHSVDEFALLDAMPVRAAWLARLLARLDGADLR
jgi:glutamate carboxypeptidase